MNKMWDLAPKMQWSCDKKKVTSRVTLDWDFSKEELMIQNWD